ncbi:MAG TPA: hypothetical protein VKX49_28460 [Bryobacteraceae bacterium]|nr:hypothetical protein [Bryobacteraceae bacterium]
MSGVIRGIFCLVSATLVTLGARWSDVSGGLPPTVGGLRALIVDNAGSNLYALTTGSLLYKSTDAGASWAAVSTIADVSAVAADPTTPSTVYAGLRRGMWKSVDGGATWRGAGLSGTWITTVIVHPSNPSTLYASDGYKLYKTTDAAASWAEMPVVLPSLAPQLPPPLIWNFRIDPRDSSTLYLTQLGPAGGPLFKSTDGGGTWSQINSGPFASLLAVSQDSKIYALRVDQNLVVSTDGGVTFTATGFQTSLTSFAIVPTDSNTLYAGTYGPNQSIIKSTDGGRTWNTVDTTAPPTSALVVNPADSSVVYAATFVRGVFKTSDSGATWNPTNSGLIVRNLFVLAAHPTDSATVYTGGDDGLFKSADGGASWANQSVPPIVLNVPQGPNGLPLPPSAIAPFDPVAPASIRSLLIDPMDPQTIYIGTHRTNGCFFMDMLLYKSTDGGANWDNTVTPKQSGCLADALLAIDPINSGTLYMRWGDDWDGFGLIKTLDAGANWTFGYAPPNGAMFNTLVIDPKTSSTIYGATDFGVFKSTDAGAHWSATSLANKNITVLAVDPLDTSTIYAIGDDVYKSTNAGGTWSVVNRGLEDAIARVASINAVAIDPVHRGTVYAATSGFGVFKTVDGGRTWSPYSDGLTHVDVRLLAIANSDPAVLYAATPAGIFTLVEDQDILSPPTSAALR